jgi:hypothetical protein
LGGGAYPCALGQGWKLLSIHSTRRANVLGFDHEAPLVSAITAFDLSDGTSVLLNIHEGI